MKDFMLLPLKDNKTFRECKALAARMTFCEQVRLESKELCDLLDKLERQEAEELNTMLCELKKQTTGG